MKDSSTRPSFALSPFLDTVDPVRVRDRYFDLLRIENKRKNLVSRETIESGLDRLFAESLIPFGIAPELAGLGSLGHYLDIGSGGGFPSVPILLTRTAERPLLIERRKTKGAALNNIIKQLAIQAELSSMDFGREKPSGRFDFVTMRLVRLTTPILKSVLGLLSETGVFLYYSQVDQSVAIPSARAKVYQFTVENSQNHKSFTVITKQP